MRAGPTVRTGDQNQITMTSTLIAADRAAVQNSFREWQAEQSLLDAQLVESVAALDAYQTHLDTWQQELAREREELRLTRAAIERERSGTAGERELDLSAALAEQQQNFEEQKRQWEVEIAQLHEELCRVSASSAASVDSRLSELSRNSPSKAEPRSAASPVLGTVMEQFGKLRLQRSMNRPNPKPR